MFVQRDFLRRSSGAQEHRWTGKSGTYSRRRLTFMDSSCCMRLGFVALLDCELDFGRCAASRTVLDSHSLAVSPPQLLEI